MGDKMKRRKRAPVMQDDLTAPPHSVKGKAAAKAKKVLEKAGKYAPRTVQKNVISPMREKLYDVMEEDRRTRPMPDKLVKPATRAKTATVKKVAAGKAKRRKN
jgi:hypothetical protein